MVYDHLDNAQVKIWQELCQLKLDPLTLLFPSGSNALKYKTGKCIYHKKLGHRTL